MSPGRSTREPRARFQRGFALIAVLALAALIAAFLISSALNRSGADVSNERDQRTRSALQQAKAALIAHAASESFQFLKNPPPPPPSNTGYFQPGALPCPDRDDDGDADCVGAGITATSSIIGRLPFKTIGADDLRDASGERLWYALSHNFRKLQCSGATVPPNCTVINGDTQGQLTVVGTQPASQVVAIVFAPGAALQGQNRDPANAIAHNNPLNYLEGPPNLADPVNYVFTTAPASSTFNDQLVIITQADVMAAVEPVVAANIARDIPTLMQSYYAKWGNYPYAMTFTSPPSSSASYKGTLNQTRGLLPVTSDPAVYWGSAAVSQLPGGSGSNVTQANCSISTSAPFQAVCRIDYDGSDFSDHPLIQIQVFLNAPATFADLPSSITSAANLSMTDHDGHPLAFQSPDYGQWSLAGPQPSVTFSSQTATITYIGMLQNPVATHNRVFLTIPLATPSYLPIVYSDPAVNPKGAWFIANQWYSQTYYAVSTGYISGGDPTTCQPPTKSSCLTVNNLPAPTDDKRVILVLAGVPLNGASRPTGNLAAYFEGANLTAANTGSRIYETRIGAPTAKNDRVVVVY